MIEPVEVRRPLGDDQATATLFYGASCIESMRRLPENSVHCMVTSPPYWGLRDYEGEPQVWGGDAECGHEWGPLGHSDCPGRAEEESTEESHKRATAGSGQFCQKCGAWLGQFGLEPTPQMYTEHLVDIFREVRRVLRNDGTCWLNLGDSYMNSRGDRGYGSSDGATGRASPPRCQNVRASGLKGKNLVGIPWRAAFALQDDGWYLRSEIIWQKPNPLPESVRDRVTCAHEHIFMLTKKAKYFYDHDAIKEPLTMKPQRCLSTRSGQRHEAMRHDKKYDYAVSDEPHQQGPSNGRNKRSVWTVTPKPYKGAHFAVFPPDLIEPCVLAGTSQRGCCPMCGTSWVRDVEAQGGAIGAVGSGENVQGDRKGPNPKNYDRLKIKGASHVTPMSRRTVGWHAGCGCPAHEPIPCKVLDPFSGSGTTGEVSLNHGRDYVGLDVNPDYLELATARLLKESAPSQEAEEGGSNILELLGVEEG